MLVFSLFFMCVIFPSISMLLLFFACSFNFKIFFQEKYLSMYYWINYFCHEVLTCEPVGATFKVSFELNSKPDMKKTFSPQKQFFAGRKPQYSKLKSACCTPQPPSRRKKKSSKPEPSLICRKNESKLIN